MNSNQQPLKDVVDIVMGQSPAGETCNRDGVGLPLLNGPTEFSLSHPSPTQFTTDPKKKSQAGDLLFCVRGSTGRMNWADQEYAIGRGIAAIRHRTNKKLQPLIRAAVEYHLPTLLQSATGSVFTNVSGPQLASVPFPILSTEEAENVAFTLGTLDDKIEVNRRMNATLEAMARAIFKDWFVDFGPTRAKMEGRKPYLAPKIWNLFPDRLDDEGKPDGWELSKIGKEVEVVGGATPSTKEPSFWEDGEHHWATPKDLSKLASPVLLDTDRRITDAGVKKISSGLLPVGTVLLSSRAPIGYLAVAEVPTSVNQGFIAMVCGKRLPNVFVLFWCNENLWYIENISGGSTFAEINKKAFRPVPIIVPSEQVLAGYERLVRPLYDRIVTNTKESTFLAQTRNLLLPKLMSGEIRLHTAELAGEHGCGPHTRLSTLP